MSEKFSIANTLDLYKLEREVEVYIAKTNEKNPYIFMSHDTIEAIYEYNQFLPYMSCHKSNPNKMTHRAFGYKVFEDNELKFGEIEIR